MRHNRKINHLGRTSSHREAMLSNMAASLILHKRITTTVAKAKALRPLVEPLINRSKEDSTHSRRMAFRMLQDKYAATELFRVVGQKHQTDLADTPESSSLANALAIMLKCVLWSSLTSTKTC